MRRIFSHAPGLTVLGFVMAVDLAFCAVGLMVDRRIITGAPAWLKPAKFALSTMLAAWSFAYCLSVTTVWPRLARALDWVLSVGLAIEIALIDLQAARGTTSHFNYATRFDGRVFGVMGVSIACIWIAMLLLTIMLFRQPFNGSAWGWSLRLGMFLALLGTGSGAFMAHPNRGQLAEARITGRMPIGGAHTVGAPDGGPGLPVTHWSTRNGDLRIAHFIGMHGLQVLPLLAWWMLRRGVRSPRALVFAAAASHLGLFGLVLWQALRGQSIVQPDRFTVEAFSMWLSLSLATVIVLISRKENIA